MKIETIYIQGVGGIINLDIKFHPNMNIICGPNGIGKTTVLESVAHCFANGETNILKRHIHSANSEIKACFSHASESINVAFQFQQYEPRDKVQIHGRYDKSQYLLSLKTTRTFAYVPLDSIGKDTAKVAHVLWEDTKNGVTLHDIKNWFANRYLYSAHKGALSEEQLKNFELAKKCFSALNSDFTFSKVNASSNEILVNTPSGEIYYEYLSSGFKSCLSILFGIIKEIEFRFSSPSITAESFDGVVLIDELELHLHPEWQYRIANVLTDIFPNVQFIVTTHSPHIIQSAKQNQIIVLENQDGETTLRELPDSKYGFKGWTLDEVLTDVMGMTDTRTQEFIDLMERFGLAIDNEDYNAALAAFNDLDDSLHPANHIRKLLRLQLASIAGMNNDQA
ncbi:MAG: AAA family ATPase [Pseudomonadota bacterium]